jgi:predicted double-glycine peptidase
MTAATARWALCLALGAVVAAGCGHTRPQAPIAAPGASWIVVPHMKFVAQAGDADCGPAALAMTLARWGAHPSSSAWPSRPVDTAGRGGVTAGGLRDEARRAGFRSYVFEGTFDDLVAEIGAGRPVILGLVRIEHGTRIPHFTVVVGHEPRRGRWLLADPALGVQDVAAEALGADWARSGWVTLVVVPDEATRKV